MCFGLLALLLLFFLQRPILCFVCMKSSIWRLDRYLNPIILGGGTGQYPNDVLKRKELRSFRVFFLTVCKSRLFYLKRQIKANIKIIRWTINLTVKVINILDDQNMYISCMVNVIPSKKIGINSDLFNFQINYYIVILIFPFKWLFNLKIFENPLWQT